MAELTPLLTWTFTKECPIPNDVQELLTAGETPVAAYKTIRDSAIFTNKRLIVRDAQGLRGKKNRNLFTAIFQHQYVVERKCRWYL